MWYPISLCISRPCLPQILPTNIQKCSSLSHSTKLLPRGPVPRSPLLLSRSFFSVFHLHHHNEQPLPKLAKSSRYLHAHPSPAQSDPPFSLRHSFLGFCGIKLFRFPDLPSYSFSSQERLSELSLELSSCPTLHLYLDDFIHASGFKCHLLSDGSKISPPPHTSLLNHMLCVFSLPDVSAWTSQSSSGWLGQHRALELGPRVFSVMPQAPRLQDDFSCHPGLCAETWKSCWTPQCAPQSLPNLSSSQSSLPAPKSGPPPLVTQTGQRPPPSSAELPASSRALPQSNPFSPEQSEGCHAPSCFTGSPIP